MKNKKLNQIGICQGRLTTPPNNELQWFPGDKWQDEFKIAGDLGYNHIELLAERIHNDSNPIWSNKGIEEIIYCSKENDIRLYSACLDYIIDNSVIKNSIINNDILDYIKNFINNCKKLGIKIVVLPFLEKSDFDLYPKKLNIELLKNIVDYAETKNIVISIETISIPEFLIEILDQINSTSIGCVYDTGNRVLLSKNPKDEIEYLSKYINHIHIKDKDKNNVNVVLGSGLVNFLDIFKVLKKINYRGGFSLETSRGSNTLKTSIHNINFIDFFVNESRFCQ